MGSCKYGFKTDLTAMFLNYMYISDWLRIYVPESRVFLVTQNPNLGY